MGVLKKNKNRRVLNSAKFYKEKRINAEESKE